jgi:hypothetical protein
MNEARIRLWLRQMEHIHGHLWRNYSVTVNQSIGEWWNVYQIIQIQIQILLLAQTHQQDMVYIAQLHDKMWYKLYIICK